MNKYFLALGLVASCALAAAPVYADTLTLTGIGSGIVAGSDYVGPYVLTVNGNAVDMFCLDQLRNVSLGQTWQADREVVSSLSSLDVKTAALILASTTFNQYLIQSDVDAQLEMWAITNLPAAQASGLTSRQASNLALITQYAGLGFAGSDAIYSQFTLEKALPNSDGSLAQDFIGPSDPIAVTPEPSSLALMGTGLLSSIGMFYRKMRLS